MARSARATVGIAGRVTGETALTTVGTARRKTTFRARLLEGPGVDTAAWWALVERLERTGCGPWWLDSALQGQGDGRWSVLALVAGQTVRGAEAVLSVLAEQTRRPRLARADRDAVAPDYTGPFDGGWMFYLPYETAWRFEPTLGAPPRDALTGEAFAVDVAAALVVDHAEHRVWLVARDAQAERRAQRHLDAVSNVASWPDGGADGARVAGARGRAERSRGLELALPGHLREAPGEAYLEAVRRARRLIADGEVFQINLSRAWRFDGLPRSASHHVLTPLAVYRRLRRANAAPFAAWFELPDATILSSSPERLVRLDAGRIETCPIAGTRPRGTTPDEDRALCDELATHPKEIAEHVMLVDLERNDLGRVARPGSVAVPSLLRVESYARVHHLVSTVVAELANGVDAADVLRATFPGGTITGCPKVQAIRRIHELEALADGRPLARAARGAYTGAIGYCADGGTLDTNILIRTLVVKASPSRPAATGSAAEASAARTIEHIAFRTGAGIVFDSVPEAELMETRHKARALIEALGLRPDAWPATADGAARTGNHGEHGGRARVAIAPDRCEDGPSP